MNTQTNGKKRIVVLGSGIVGQATGLGMIEKGHDVTFLDINVALVKSLRQKGLTAAIIGVDNLSKIQFDILMVCISTPPHPVTRAVELTNIKNGMKTVGELIKNQESWPVVVVRSTVPPTTTEKILLPLIEEHSGMQVNNDFGLCMNPEFLRAKSSVKDFAQPWATVIGAHDEKAGQILTKLYEPFGGKIFVVSLSEAEFIKYQNNLQNALIISFYNEMWLYGEQMGIDSNKASAVVAETAESSWNSMYGKTGGYPYGGTCLPKDTCALLAQAKKHGINLPLLEQVVSVNDHMLALALQGEVPEAMVEGLNWMARPEDK